MKLHKTIIEKAHCRSTWPKTVAEKKRVGAKCILMSIFKILPDDLHSVANLEINKENEKKKSTYTNLQCSIAQSNHFCKYIDLLPVSPRSDTLDYTAEYLQAHMDIPRRMFPGA